MKILWLTAVLPCLRGGAQVRQWQLIRRLAAHHSVRVLSLLAPGEQAEVAPLRSLGVELDTVPYQPLPPRAGWGNRVRTWGRQLSSPAPALASVYPVHLLREPLRGIVAAWRPDVVQVDQLFAAPLGAAVAGRPWVLQEHNVESSLARTQLAYERRPARRLFGGIEAWKLGRWERAWLRRCTVCVAVSELDAAALRRMAPGTPVRVAPNGVAAEDFTPSATQAAARAGLLFFGTLDFPSNIDALLYFCREIWPLILRAAPQAQLTIIGARAGPDIVALGSLPGVNYLGFVPDVRPHLWAAAACVASLRSGGGTRFKILEALAAGCAVLSTAKGAEGLDLQPGRDFALADDPPRFAAEAVRLLADPLYRQTLAAQGQAAVRARYDWSQVVPALEQAYVDAIERRSAAPPSNAS